MLALLRTLLFTDPMVVLLTSFMGALSLLTVPFDPTGSRQIRLARIWARVLVFVMRIKITVEGLEKIDTNRNYLFVCNHLSYTDTPVILSSIPVDFRFMAKKELFSIPLMGHHLKTAGHISVALDNPRQAVRSMTEAGRMIRERGISVLNFPEGGRTEGVLEPFKEGPAFIAIKAGVPIVPMALIGTRAIMPMHGFTIRGGKVRVVIGDPIPTAGLIVRDRERVTLELRARIAEQLGLEPPIDAVAHRYA